MLARAVISGRLTQNGKPLAGAYIGVPGEQDVGIFGNDSSYGLPAADVTTDKNGRYRLLVSAPRTFQMTIGASDSISQEATVFTRPSQNSVVNRELKPFPYGSIRGLVTDLKGKPLAGATIELWNSNTSEAGTAATTDKRGLFFIKKAEPYDQGWAFVRLPSDGYSTSGQSEKLKVRSYRTTNVTIRIDAEKPKLELPPPRVVSGVVKVLYRARDNLGVSYVALSLDGGNLGNGKKMGVRCDGKLPRVTSSHAEWDTRRLRNGRHRLRVEAFDEAGNRTKHEWFVWIQNKNAPKQPNP